MKRLLLLICLVLPVQVFAQARLVSDPAAAVFGAVPVGSSKSISVKLINKSTSTIRLDSVLIESTANGFALQDKRSVQITPNGTIDVTVTYTPFERDPSETRLAAFLNGELTPTLLIPVSGQSASVFELGDIPQQEIWQGSTLRFFVADSSRPSAELNFSSNGHVNSRTTFSFSKQSGLFTCSLDTSDKEVFYLTFSSKLGDSVRSKLVECTPRPVLPAEQTMFGLKERQPVPDSTLMDYLVHNIEDNPGTEEFNHVRSVTGSVGIVGKTVIIESGNPNNIYKSYFENPGAIKDVAIYAERLIVREELKIPQGNLKIFARTLVFEDKPGASAFFNLKPLPFKDVSVQGSGSSGGTIDVNVEQLITSNPILTRFVVSGGDGHLATPPNTDPSNGGAGGTIVFNPFTSDLSVLQAICDVHGGLKAGNGTNGNEGAVSFGKNGSSWLQPHWLRMVLAHARDAYLLGNMTYTHSLCDDYIDKLSFLLAKNALDSDPQSRDEVQQIVTELSMLRSRIDHNLDFFGKPAGWVPMLSFELSAAIYEKQVNRNVQYMYLSQWLGGRIRQRIAKLRADSVAKDQLSKEITDFTNDYTTAVALIKELEIESARITDTISVLQVELQNIEAALAARAQSNVDRRHQEAENNVPWWRKACKIAGAICKVIPVYQPVLGVIGTGLDIVSEFNPKDPWSSVNQLKGLSGQFSDENLSKSADQANSVFKTLSIQQFEKNPQGYINQIRGYADSMMSAVETTKKKLREREAPKNEVEVELHNLRATDPAFLSVTARIAQLHVRQEIFAKQVAELSNKLLVLSNGIRTDLLAIRAITSDISKTSAGIDIRAELYLKEMERRAKERLLQLKYYVIKAYEFEALKPWPNANGILVNNLFDRFKRLGQDSTTPLLSSQDYKDLSAAYYEDLDEALSQIVSEFQNGNRSTNGKASLTLTQAELATLNQTGHVRIQTEGRGLFFESAGTSENLRIQDIHVNDQLTHLTMTGPANSSNQIRLTVWHSGISKIVAGGDSYLFKHLDDKSSMTSEAPIGYHYWTTDYDPNTGVFDYQGDLTKRDKSLLEYISGRTSSDLQAFSMPGAYTELDIELSKNISSLDTINVDALTLTMHYDYHKADASVSALRVQAADNNMSPYFIVSRSDKPSRQDGVGRFLRFYDRGAQLSVSTPRYYGKGYGVWKFLKWTDAQGQTIASSDSTNTTIRVQMNGARTLQALYAAPPSKVLISGPDSVASNTETAYGLRLISIAGDTSFVTTNSHFELIETHPATVSLKNNNTLVVGAVSSGTARIAARFEYITDDRDTLTLSDTIRVGINAHAISIEASGEANRFEVRVSPAKDRVVVKSYLTKGGNYSLRLQDLLGREIYSQNLELHSLNESSNVIRIEDLPSGIYLVSLIGNGQQFTRKMSFER